MPWTAQDMANKGAKRPGVAMRIANTVLLKCLADGHPRAHCEVKAIRVGLATSNKRK